MTILRLQNTHVAYLKYRAISCSIVSLSWAVEKWPFLVLSEWRQGHCGPRYSSWSQEAEVIFVFLRPLSLWMKRCLYVDKPSKQAPPWKFYCLWLNNKKQNQNLWYELYMRERSQWRFITVYRMECGESRWSYSWSRENKSELYTKLWWRDRD